MRDIFDDDLQLMIYSFHQSFSNSFDFDFDPKLDIGDGQDLLKLIWVMLINLIIV